MDDVERNRLVESVVPWAYALVNRYVADRGRRDDAYQDLMLRVLRGAHTYDPAKGKPTTWCATIAIRMFARPTRRNELPTRPLPFKIRDPKQRLAEDTMDDSEQRVKVREVLDRLPAEDADLLRRHVVEGLPLAACDRSISRERMRQKYNRALGRARQLMND